MINTMKTFLITIVAICFSFSAFAQSVLSENDAIQIALKNNQLLKSGEYQVAMQKQMKNTAYDFGKTNFTWMHGQFNSILKDNNYTITQSIPFPTSLASHSKLASAQVEGAEIQLTMTKNDLVKEVRSTYHQLAYVIAIQKELVIQDSVFAKFANATQVRYRVGEGTLLEKTTAEMQALEIKNQLVQNESDIGIYKRQLQTLLNTRDDIDISFSISKIAPSEVVPTATTNPQLHLLKQEITIADRSRRVENNKLLPDILVGYFSQSLIGFQRVNNNDVYFDKNDRFTGFELGVSLPLWFVPQRSKAKAAALQQESSLKKYEFYQNQIEGEMQRAQLELAKNETSLQYYESNANPNAALIITQAQKAFQEGEIGYLEFFQAINQARSIKLNYLQTLNQYNQAAIQMDYLAGNF